MYEKTIVLELPQGLHIRPLTTFVRKAKTYKSEINITSEGVSAKASSLFKLQTLNLAKGTTIKISANGEDEELAVNELIDLLGTLE